MSRASYYRFKEERQLDSPKVQLKSKPKQTKCQTKPAQHARKTSGIRPRLSAETRKTVLATLTNAEFVDDSVYQVHAKLLDRGLYYCSVRSMYRILKAAGANTKRGRQRERQKPTKPYLIARGVNQVWSWDVTKIRGPENGHQYSLFVVLDIFSRAVVAWEVVTNENQKTAVKLLSNAFKVHGIEPGQLKLHSDNGSVMRSAAVERLLRQHGVEASFSRPGVSNDNPFSEAQFKTVKYDRRYPREFGSLEECHSYLEGYMDYYNNEHRHSGIGYCTPGSVHSGQSDSIIKARQEVLDRAYESNPGQFGDMRPITKEVPKVVGINAHGEVKKLNRVVV